MEGGGGSPRERVPWALRGWLYGGVGVVGEWFDLIVGE